MQLASHEVHDLNELTLSCVNTITCMGLFLNQVKDQELKSILQNQYQLHINDYNAKVEYLNSSAATKTGITVPGITHNIQNTNQAQASAQPITPRTDAKELNDREIATAYLLTLKRSGREYAWSAMECSNPDLRHFLEDAFVMCCHHSYDVWQWMVKKGYYPLEAAPQNIQNTIGQMYKAVTHNASSSMQ